jgi:soluble cytochrome b562
LRRLTTQFDSINKVETEHFMKLLAHYSAILQKIQDHATVLAGKGKDIATTNTEITSAKSAIMTAQAAVTAQAAKTYVLDTTLFKVTSATTTAKGQDQLMKGFRTAFQKLHTSLKADLMALRNGPMKDARAAVKAALEALIKISSVNDGAEAGATSTNATSTN